MFRPMCIVLWVCCVSGSALADAKADAQRRVNQAETDLRNAEKRLSDARAAEERARTEQARLSAYKAELPQLISRAEEQVADIRKKVDSAKDELPKAQAELSAAQKAVADLQAAIPALREKSAASEKAAASAKASLQREFETTEAYRSARSDVERAQEAYDRRVSERLRESSGAGDFAKLEQEVARLEARVKQLRAEGPESELPQASMAWMNAKSRYEKTRSAIVEGDPAVQSLRKTLEAAKAKLKALQDQFDESLAKDPKLGPLLEQARSDREALAESTAGLDKARKTLAEAQVRVAEQTRLVNAGAQAVRQAEATVAARKQEQATIDRAIAEAQSRERIARDNQAREQRNVEDCRRRLDEARRALSRL